MKLALVQYRQNVLFDYKNKPRFTLAQIRPLQQEMIDQNLALLEQTVGKGRDLVVTSECINSTGFTPALDGGEPALAEETAEKLLPKLADIARRGNTWLVADVSHVKKGRLYNSAFVFGRDGEIVDVYDKIHLPGSEKDSTQPGSRLVHFDTGLGRVGVCICWDMQFPEICRAYAAAGCRLVVCPTWGWEQIYAHARAYENGIFVAAAMAVPYPESIRGLRTPSELVAPDGRVVARAGHNAAQVLYCEADLTQGTDLWKERMDDRRRDLYPLPYPWRIEE